MDISIDVKTGFVRVNNSNGHLDNGGYIQFHPTKGVKYLAHRLVMEKFLNRKLKKSEVIHHLNGIKTDNRISNLSLLSNQSTHASIHFPKHFSKCHPDRELHDSKTKTCNQCYSKLYKQEARMGKRPTEKKNWCHPEKRHLSRGMCTRCYQQWKKHGSVVL